MTPPPPDSYFTPLLRFMGNLAASDHPLDCLVTGDFNCITVLKHIINNDEVHSLHLVEALWTMSNLAADSSSVVTEALERSGLMQDAIDLCLQVRFSSISSKAQKELTFVLSNLAQANTGALANHHRSDFVHAFVDGGGVEALMRCLSSSNDESMSRCALNGLTALSANSDALARMWDADLLSYLDAHYSDEYLPTISLRERLTQHYDNGANQGAFRFDRDPAARDGTFAADAQRWILAAKNFLDKETVDAVYEIQVPACYQRGVHLFLQKLEASKEFTSHSSAGLATRGPLARRVCQVLELLVKGGSRIQEEVFMRMADSVDACHDKPVWALNQLQVLAETVKARGDPVALRALARRLKRLDVVHHCAQELIATRGGFEAVDDVCVFLKYEIKLAQALDLPVSAQEMFFPSQASITDTDIQRAMDAALEITDEEYEAFLLTWSEWQRHERSQVLAAIEYDKLKRTSRNFRISLQNVLGSRVSDPVRFHGSTVECSFQDLKSHWLETGCDLNNVPRDSEAIRTLERPTSMSLQAFRRLSNSSQR